MGTFYGGVGLYGGAYGNYGTYGLYGSLLSYGSLSLTDGSPPQSFAEPLSVEEMISYLRLPRLDQRQTDELGAFIVAAREQAEILQNRDLVRKQWDLVYDFWPSFQIEFRVPLVSVDLAQYKDSTGTIFPLIENTDYILDKAKQPGILTPPYNKRWPVYAPWPSSSLLFRYTSGYASNSVFWSDAGARLKVGMKLLISDWWNVKYPAQVSQDADGLPRGLRNILSQGALARAR